MQEPGFFARIGLAFGAFFKILFDGKYAAKVIASTNDSSPPVRDTAPHAIAESTPVPDTMPVPSVEPTSATEPMPDPMLETRKALQFIGAMQREGRLVDFLMEDLSAAADADIGAAARVVHGGCKKVLSTYLTIEPVWPGEEGTRVNVEEGFDPNRVSLTGQVKLHWLVMTLWRI